MVTSLPQLLQQRHHARRFGDAQSGHRLVEQQQLRFGGERDRELELALLAMAQFGRPARRRAGSSPTRVERGARRVAQLPFLARIAPETEGVTVMGLRRQRDIVERGEIGQQRGDLERARQPERAAPIGRQPGDVPAGEVDGAGIRQQLPGELADQRGLAGAVRPDDGVQFARARHRARDCRSRRCRRTGGPGFRRGAADQPRLNLPSRPMMPPRPNSTISSNSGPMISAQYSVSCDRNSSSTR